MYIIPIKKIAILELNLYSKTNEDTKKEIL